MSAGDNQVAPIIIKRKKVVAGGGHHGGAWKVAYADFVTAMMAFFLLMWLLNATTEKQRKGIADYFTPTIAMARVSGGGNGPLGGESVFAENTLPRMGTGSTSLNPATDSKAKGQASSGAEDNSGTEEKFEMVEDMLMGRGGESMVADEALDHIITEVTDEGLVVEFFETHAARLFDDNNKPTKLLRDLARILVSASTVVANPLAIEGHTASFPVVLAQNPAWEVTNARAIAFRDLLVAGGIPEERVHRITSHADREPAQKNPMDVRNNRLEVIFLRTK